MITVFNPLKDDFEGQYDINGDGNPVSYSVPSLGFTEFENDVIANHCIKHLAKSVVFTRGVEKNFKDDYDEVVKEITV